MGKINPNNFYVDGWLVEAEICRLSKLTCESRVEPKVMQVLVMLANAAPGVVRKENLLSGVWGDVNVVDNVLTRAVSSIRKAFGDDPKAPRIVETIPRIGYRLIAPVTKAADTASYQGNLEPVQRRRYLHEHSALLYGVAAALAIISLFFLVIVLSADHRTAHRIEHVKTMR